MITESLLDDAIEVLDYKNGRYVDVAGDSKYDKDWMEHGDLIASAQKAGARSIFFVQNNPVIVFANCADEGSKIATYNKLWCLARPRILFLECEGELSVIDLAQAPIKIAKSTEQESIKTLKVLESARDAASELKKFHRDNIESGKVFAEYRFGDARYRADRALIADLKEVRRELLNAGLSAPQAHALIGRSIFIRYLEDRGILTYEYFAEIARHSDDWLARLENPTSRDLLDFSEISASYPRVLQNKEFTYALFRSLADAFNGDMFPNIDDEEAVIEPRHLHLIQDMLYGDVGVQKKLFFFSYSFDVIPLNLIGAIYEEFYNVASDDAVRKSRAREHGVYYTPLSLVEFVVARTLTDEVLESKPRILDPACGSGIFLTEAFRRVVRYEISQENQIPTFSNLKEVLRNRICGIEISEDAARITAFSLYIAMLHYVDPPSIREHIAKGSKLPKLIAAGQTSGHGSIFVGNAFGIADDVLGKFEVIVGNPPWGSPGLNASQEAKERQSIMREWCKKNSCPIGDREASQAFLWRATTLLKADGICALLVSAGVLLKISGPTRAFRREWMKRVRLTEIFNFTHVRRFFFQGADSPFVLIRFRNSEQGNNPVEYWSPKEVRGIAKMQAVLLSAYDRNLVNYKELCDNRTWKVNWFGRRADVEFINYLEAHFDKLGDYIGFRCVGYKAANKKWNADWLSDFRSLKNSSFSRYGPLEFEDGPAKVERRGKSRNAYMGPRLVVKEGMEQRDGSLGRIISRIENRQFSFNHSIHVLKLKDEYNRYYDLLCGIMWSSLARYFFFHMSSNWGIWRHKVLLAEWELLPISMEESERSDNVVSVVRNLRASGPQAGDALNPGGTFRHEKLESELDDAVFDYYDLSDDQRDLVRDFCEVTLPFLYKPLDGPASMPAVYGPDVEWMEKYAETFARRWKPYLNEGEVMRGGLHLGASDNIIAIEFYSADPDDDWDLTPRRDAWAHLLDEISKELVRSMGTSQILLDGLVQVVSDNGIIIVKRNEKRFWTRSLAREDADSSLCKAMRFEMEHTPEN